MGVDRTSVGPVEIIALVLLAFEMFILALCAAKHGGCDLVRKQRCQLPNRLRFVGKWRKVESVET